MRSSITARPLPPVSLSMLDAWVCPAVLRAGWSLCCPFPQRASAALAATARCSGRPTRVRRGFRQRRRSCCWRSGTAQGIGQVGRCSGSAKNGSDKLRCWNSPNVTPRSLLKKTHSFLQGSGSDIRGSEQPGTTQVVCFRKRISNLFNGLT